MSTQEGVQKWPAKSCLLAMILVSFSYAYASGATGSIGTVSARGDLRVDGYTVWGNGTLFNGTAVETGQATATLRLDNGTEIKLAINSHGVVYRDHLVLLQGRSQLKTSGAPFLPRSRRTARCSQCTECTRRCFIAACEHR